MKLNFKPGIPKICVPLSAGSLNELLREAAGVMMAHADLAEWRADYFKGDIMSAASAVKEALGDIPLLFTYRTVAEGGYGGAYGQEYLTLNRAVISAGLTELLDIELSAGESICRELTGIAREFGVTTVLSSHNFESTPPVGDMLAVMRRAIELGGDIPKLAVMPKKPSDVLELLMASSEFARENPGRPLIAMSMGRLGAISRIAGEFFGSGVTFASLERATAPGQIPINELRDTLEILHRVV